MTGSAATVSQCEYIIKLAESLNLEIGLPKTKKVASALIEELKAQQAEKWVEQKKAKIEAEKDALEGVEPLKAGRVNFKGEILIAKSQESCYGTQYKMLLKDAYGRKVWMTVPKSVLGECNTLAELKGMKVAGVVTLQPKEDDPHFAFGSRPAGFEKVA